MRRRHVRGACAPGLGRGRGPELAILAILAITGLGACSGPSPRPPSSVPVVTSPPTAGPVATPSPIQQPHGPSIAPVGVDVDLTLLDMVPAAEAGAELVPDPETSASVAADRALARDVSYLAIGLARPRDAAADDPNLAIVNVVRLRSPGDATDDTWFRDWRDSFDEPACARAGGVARHAQTTIDQIPVFVAACANDAFTYHARIGDGALVLSITSIGPADLGRSIVEKLHR
ncbi:MAG TPA: hypothetical protein VM427_03380 [Patescibacteria group bacterium]|nr:hypothetical protein [Patescibacteria group bacterium]